MKKPILISSILIAAIALLSFDFFNNSSFLSGGGAAPGYCGDPAGGNKTCTSCHSGPDATFISELITSDIPAEGYTPNTEYSISATITGNGHSKFGFEVSAQDSIGNFVGTISTTSPVLQLTGSGNNYITHTSDGTGGLSSKTWTFEWTSPAEETGEVTFYGAFIVSNADLSTSGDTVYTSTMDISEIEIVGLAKNAFIEKSISVYPNPATDQISIRVNNNTPGLAYVITDQSGRQLLRGELDQQTTKVDISQLKAGTYFCQAGGQRIQTFIVIKQ